MDAIDEIHKLLSPDNKLLRTANNGGDEIANEYDFICERDEKTVDFDEELNHLEENSFSFGTEGAEVGLETGTGTYQVVLDPRHKTKLYAEIKYPVTQITKNIGDSFKKGDLLIQMEDTVALGEYQKELAGFKKANAELEATKELFKEQLASFFELKDAEAKFGTAEANLILAEKNWRASKIKAPYDGIVVALSVEEHELPQQGKELIKIIDDQVLIAKLLVPSSLLPKIYIGQPIAIHLAETDKTVIAKITRIGGMIDPSSSTIRVEAEIDNKDRKLKAGSSGIASFSFQQE